MLIWADYNKEQKVLYILRWIMGLMALAGSILLLLDYGFYLSRHQHEQIGDGFVIVGFLFVFGYIAQLIIRRDRRQYLRANLIKYVLTLLMVLEILLVYVFRQDLQSIKVFHDLGILTFKQSHTLFFQVYILFNILRWIVKIMQFLAQFNASPAHFILLSFSGAILMGSVLLLLPKSTIVPLTPIDALFTATSAVCVTGLIVVDTATAFTRNGQIIILGLIQIGGLGIMTVTAFFSLLVGQRMSGREQVLLGDMLNTDRLVKLSSVLKIVFLTTLGIETCGALLLYSSWQGIFPVRQAIYFSIFHAISAFCNAGFSTFSDSLVQFAGHVRINLIVCALILLGGIGFGTLSNLAAFIPKKSSQGTAAHLSVQTKLILIMTALLLVFGTLMFFVLEHNSSLDEASFSEKMLGALFQSVTFRTAGFNTVDFSALRDSTLMFAIPLMFIGAAPGSTGGGLKITTIAILLSTVFAIGRGRSRVELFRRSIPTIVFYQTIVVITLYLVVALSVSFLLTLTENQRPIELLFETISALGTVGVTTGVTPELSTLGRILIIGTMFLGRIGPFTLALAIGERQQSERYRYPEERVQIG
ncbi:MAG: hypothetical protein GY801_14990 [bacterium]|nr:hypothetical protein [bacterium]